MKYNVVYTSKFHKDMKRIKKRGYNMKLFDDVLKILVNGEELPPKYRDHQLKGGFAKCRECHITPEWLLVYRINESVLELWLMETGSHSDLF